MGPFPVLAGDQSSCDAATVTVSTAHPTRALHALTGWAVARRLEREGLVVERASLEEVYLELTRTAA